MIWEYSVFTVGDDPDLLGQALNQAGAEGWEAISVVPTTAIESTFMPGEGQRTPHWVAVLKRTKT